MSFSWIQLPDGYRFPLEAMRSIVADGAGLLLTPLDGTPPFRWEATDQRYAKLVDAALVPAMTTPTGFTPIAPATIIDSITLDNPDITVANVVVKGAGFYAGIVGFLYVEDSPGGGQDDNGYRFPLKFVDGNTLTGANAVVPPGGDGIIGPGAVILYYRDANGLASNNIAGTNPSGTLVTIP